MRPTCEDCGTKGIIKTYPRGSPHLCAACLRTRAQIQTLKEDKLPFPELLNKIRGEMHKRVRSEMGSISAIDRLERYKGSIGYSLTGSLSSYWVDQLYPTRGGKHD